MKKFALLTCSILGFGLAATPAKADVGSDEAPAERHHSTYEEPRPYYNDAPRPYYYGPRYRYYGPGYYVRPAPIYYGPPYYAPRAPVFYGPPVVYHHRPRFSFFFGF